jgi:SpoVK/Ycf46/Vps4 family AAA+-type ATPase
MGRGNNEIAPEDIDVTFDDVKGCEEAKQELQEIVEFLMHPVNDIFKRLFKRKAIFWRFCYMRFQSV